MLPMWLVLVEIKFDKLPSSIVSPYLRKVVIVSDQNWIWCEDSISKK
jgi:hypothetical protein